MSLFKRKSQAQPAEAPDTREGIDLDAAYRADGDGPAADLPPGHEGPAEAAAEDQIDGDEGGGAVWGSDKKDGVDEAADVALGEEQETDSDDLDLMDIFSEEDANADSGVGALEKFLHPLTMQQVAAEAEQLLEEFRAI